MLLFLNTTFTWPKTVFSDIVPSGNKDYIIIIIVIILWGIKDSSHKSIALKK